MAENFAESGDFHVTFWVLLHTVILRHGTDGYTGVNTARFLLVCHARTEKFHIALLLPGLIITITIKNIFL